MLLESCKPHCGLSCDLQSHLSLTAMWTVVCDHWSQVNPASLWQLSHDLFSHLSASSLWAIMWPHVESCDSILTVECDGTCSHVTCLHCGQSCDLWSHVTCLHCGQSCDLWSHVTSLSLWAVMWPVGSHVPSLWAVKWPVGSCEPSLWAVSAPSSLWAVIFTVESCESADVLGCHVTCHVTCESCHWLPCLHQCHVNIGQQTLSIAYSRCLRGFWKQHI